MRAVPAGARAIAAKQAILATAGRGQADAADPTLRQLALATFDRVRIGGNAVARWRDSAAALYAALEARGHVEGHLPEGPAPPAPASGPIDG